MSEAAVMNLTEARWGGSPSLLNRHDSGPPLGSDNEIEGELEPLEIWQAVLISIPLSVLALWIIVSNAFVILSVLFVGSMRTPTNVYLASLASTDFLVGLVILPFAIIQIVHNYWTLGACLCKIWLTLDVALSTLSIFHLIAIAVDRYRVVTDGVSYIQKRAIADVISVIACLWCISIWIATPPVLGWGSWEDIEVKERYICDYSTTRGYVLHSAFGSFIFPMYLMISLYLKIYRNIQTKIRERSAFSMPSLENSAERELSETETETSSTFLKGKRSIKSESPGNEMESKENILRSRYKRPSSQMQEIIAKKIRFSLTKERRAAKTLGIIIGAFVACWLPFCIMYVLTPFFGPPPVYVYHFITWLGYINSAINPIVYCICNNDFKKVFKQTFCRCIK